MLETVKTYYQKIFGSENKRKLDKRRPMVEAVNELEDEMSALSDTELMQKTPAFKERLQGSETLDDILPEAYAVVREASKRTLGLRHYDVQVLGAIIMHEGAIAEMKTGEGKTLAATMPLYLNALKEDGAHLVTVNDYLARRDTVWMGQIYDFLGLSVGVINQDGSYLYDEEYSQEKVDEKQAVDSEDELDEERDEEGYYKVSYEYLRPCDRPEAYAADITYGTNNQFGFDYLRDNLAYDPDEIRQSNLPFAIIDEIDFVLIDEARTPLIISAPAEEAEDLYKRFASIAKRLQAGTHFEVDKEKNAIMMMEEGIEKAEDDLGIDNIYTEKGVNHVHHLENAVRAKALYEKDQEYVLKDGEVVIVDEFTGRLMPGRRWSGGLHQAVEAKEGVALQQESRTFASVTFQNFFRMYDTLSGMTGTAMSSSEEFYKVYDIDTIAVPTNEPVRRDDHDDLIFQTEMGKFKAIARKINELNEKGQPVLIGTVSIEKNELLSEFLQQKGIPHEVLNAKNHEREGEIIASAGAKGAVTLATNMAGRGVDIKLGGKDATRDEYTDVKELGGLFVLGTERHESRRIDNQLRGRAGRQGDPGESQFFVSLEDELMQVFASETVKNMMGRFGIPEDQPIENPMISRALENAQEKIEGKNFDARKHVLKFDEVLHTQRKELYARRREILTGDYERLQQLVEEVADGDEEYLEKIEKRKEHVGEEPFYEAVRRGALQTIDMLWVEHIDSMDYLRSSVNLRAYGQKDPLVEYKKEGKRMFESMQVQINEQIKELLPNIGEGAFERERRKLQEVHKEAESLSQSDEGDNAGRQRQAGQPNQDGTSVTTSASTRSGGTSGPIGKKGPTTEDGTKIGRNDRVIITKGEREKEMKFKKAQPMLEQDGWEIKEVITN